MGRQIPTVHCRRQTPLTGVEWWSPPLGPGELAQFSSAPDWDWVLRSPDGTERPLPAVAQRGDRLVGRPKA